MPRQTWKRGYATPGDDMTPDQIKQAIESSFPKIRSKPRRNPDGWAFYLGEIREGPHSTRIARAVRKTPVAATKFKLAVTRA
jgi:hypothetical protein